MRFSTMLALAVGVSAAGTAVEKRAAAVKRAITALSSDLATIDTDVKAITTAANTYSGGGLANALPVETAANTADSAIKQATTDAGSAGTASAADSATLITAIQGLIPDVQAALSAVVSKMSDFTTDGASSIVVTTLQTLKTDTDALSKALIAIADSSVTTEANCLAAEIDAIFANGLAAFGTGSSTAISSCAAGSAAATTAGASAVVSSAAATTAATTAATGIVSASVATSAAAVSVYTGAAVPGAGSLSGPLAGAVALLAAWAL